MKTVIAKTLSLFVLALLATTLVGCGGGGGSASGSSGSTVATFISSAPDMGGTLPSAPSGGAITTNEPSKESIAIAKIHNPEPTTMLLLGSGLMAMAYRKRKQG